jgi:NAD(P)-dependent dehydrogenase (short-subunit alcohol dehydrogenase family)
MTTTTLTTTTLITGANKGLGREAARQLVAAGHLVYVGARDADRGRAAAAAVEGRYIPLDATSDDSVRAAAKLIDAEIGHLDVLVNNAGIAGTGFRPAGETTADDMQVLYATNVFGVVRVTQAFLPLLRNSAAPVIVNVSSGMGSFAVTTDPSRFESTLVGLAYPSSKAALNMVTTMYAKAYPGMRVNAVDPGYTATDLNGHRGTQTVEEGVRAIVTMARITADGPTGTFSDAAGAVGW